MYVGEDNDGHKDKDIDIDKDKWEDKVTATGDDQGDNKFNEGDDKVDKGEDKVIDTTNNKGDNSIEKGDYNVENDDEDKDEDDDDNVNHNFVEDSFFHQTHSWMLSKKLVAKHVLPAILLQQRRWAVSCGKMCNEYQHIYAWAQQFFWGGGNECCKQVNVWVHECVFG